MYYSQAASEKSPEHLDCENCDDCQSDRQLFKESLEEHLTTAAGEKWKDYGLDSLLQTVIDVSEMESTNPENWTIKTDRLVKVLRSERKRIEQIERFNNRKPEN